MRLIPLAVVYLLLLVACGPTAVPTPSPTGTPSATLALRPLPAGLAGIPQPGTPTAVLEPRTQRGTIPPNVPHRFELGHCGLMSPIDFDGSLWDPVAGDDGSGGPLTDEHQGELFNATPVGLTLIEPDLIRLETPLGAVLTLVRHAGARAYSFCD